MQVSPEFIKEFSDSQSRIYALIFSLVMDAELAKDILQNTNVVIWEKSADFQPGSSFTAWAFEIARFQVLAARNKMARDRLVFGDELSAKVHELLVSADECDRDRLDDLQSCLDRLPQRHRDLVIKRYSEGAPIKDIAAAMNRTANSVSVMLHKIRVTLLNCIKKSQRKHGGT